VGTAGERFGAGQHAVDEVLGGQGQGLDRGRDLEPAGGEVVDRDDRQAAPAGGALRRPSVGVLDGVVIEGDAALLAFTGVDYPF